MEKEKRHKKSFRKNPCSGTTAEKSAGVDMDLSEMAFIFAFEPHPVIFS